MAVAGRAARARARPDRELARGVGQRDARRARVRDRRGADRRRGGPPGPPLPDRPRGSCRSTRSSGSCPTRRQARSARASCASGCRGAEVVSAASTADAVRIVAESDQPWAALGTGWRRSSTAAWCSRTASRTCRRTRPASCGWRSAGPANGRSAEPREPAASRPRSSSGACRTHPARWSSVLQEFAERERQPEQDRVASAQAGARPLHLLRRPRRARRRARDRRRARGRGARRSRRCACSGATRPLAVIAA